METSFVGGVETSDESDTEIESKSEVRHYRMRNPQLKRRGKLKAYW